MQGSPDGRRLGLAGQPVNGRRGPLCPCAAGWLWLLLPIPMPGACSSIHARRRPVNGQGGGPDRTKQRHRHVTGERVFLLFFPTRTPAARVRAGALQVRAIRRSFRPLVRVASGWRRMMICMQGKGKAVVKAVTRQGSESTHASHGPTADCTNRLCYWIYSSNSILTFS
jgi:hypothetical protein